MFALMRNSFIIGITTLSLGICTVDAMEDPKQSNSQQPHSSSANITTINPHTANQGGAQQTNHGSTSAGPSISSSMKPEPRTSLRNLPENVVLNNITYHKIVGEMKMVSYMVVSQRNTGEWRPYDLIEHITCSDFENGTLQFHVTNGREGSADKEYYYYNVNTRVLQNVTKQKARNIQALSDCIHRADRLAFEFIKQPGIENFK